MSEPSAIGSKLVASFRPPASEPVAEQAASPLPAMSGETHRFSFHGSPGSLWSIYVVNLFLTLVTLGIYSFWGRVKVRKYLFGQAEFEGDRFAYHGTGMELLAGFFKAFLIVAAVMALSALPQIFRLGKNVAFAVNLFTFIVFLLFVPIATVGALRYRLSRISWRSIRFSFRGGAFDYLKLFVGGSLLMLITLGLYYPLFAVQQYGFFVSHAYLGNEKFSFDGRGKDLFWSYVIAILLTLPTLGLCWFWFMARAGSYLFSHTVLAGARFRYAISGGKLLVFYLSNFLLLLVTFGSGFPWVMVRSIRFVFDALTLEGSLDLPAIQQEAQIATATGEGLAGILDVDLGIT